MDPVVATLSYDVAAVRRDFPILGRSVTVRGTGEAAPLIYLDNAATSQKPRQVLDAVIGYYERMNANVHRALHRLGEEATTAFEESRSAVAESIGARSPAEIVFTRGTTEGINLIASAWGRANVREGDEILLTEMEHHSNLIPWQLLAAEKGAHLRFIPIREDGTLDLDAIESLLTERTRIVAVTHVSNVLGTINDVRSIIDAAHARDIPVLVDAAQSVPHIPVDVGALDCDFLAFSGHKMCAPTGIGVLYGKESLLADMRPYQGGGEMIRAVWYDRAEWNVPPYKFEAGTPDIAGAIGLGAAVDYLRRIGMPAIRLYEEDLTRYALARLEEVEDIRVYGSSPDRGAVISFNVGSIHPHDVAQILDSDGVAVRAGHHCAQPLMRKLGVAATARASLSFYNTAEEVDRSIGSLEKAREFFRRVA